MDKLIFLALSLISGTMELGGVLYAISIRLSVIEIVGIGLAYQIGNLVPNPLKLNKAMTCTASFLSVVCFAYINFLGFNYWVLFAGFILAAMTIQSLRSRQKGNVGTTVKRTFRILGFLVAPFVNMSVSLVVCIILCSIAITTKMSGTKFEVVKPTIRFINVVMVSHQIHYFSYAYFIIIIISQLVGKVSPFLIGILFTLGWLTYTSISLVLRKESYVKYFAAGHLFLAAMLFALASYSDSMIAVLLWIITGFGGGTVFCIEKVNERFKESSKEGIVFSENIGHIIGVLLGMFIYLAAGKLNYPVYLSSTFAALTMVLMLIYNLKAGKKVGVRAEERSI